MSDEICMEKSISLSRSIQCQSVNEQIDNEKDFELAIGLNRVLLEPLGLWPSIESNSPRIFALPAMVTWMFTMFIIPMMCALFQVRNQLPLVVDNISLSLNSIEGCTKLFLLWKGRDLLKSLVLSVWYDWHVEKSSFERRLMLLQAKRARLLTIICSFAISGLFIAFTLLPIFNVNIRSLNNMTDPHPSRHFLIPTYYPFNIYRSPIYEIAYIFQVAAGLVSALSFILPENLFAVFVLHACAQCQVAESQFKQLVKKFVVTDEISFVQQHGKIVKSHIRLIKFVQNVEDVYSYLVLAKVICLTVTMGCFGFTLTETIAKEAGLKDFIRLAVLLGSVLALMMSTLLYCGAGELLTSNSSRLLNAAYQSNVHSLLNVCTRDLIIVMICTQSPLELTAGKFFPLTLNTFLQLMKTAGGYISMLLTVNN